MTETSKAVSLPDYLHLRESLADALLDDWERLAAYLSRTLPRLHAGHALPISKNTDPDRDPDDPPPDEVDQALSAYDFRPFGQALQTRAVLDPLTHAYTLGVGQAEGHLGIVWNLRDPRAIAYAQARAAEMVGMRRATDGQLRPNPDAKRRITDETRKGLHDLVVEAMETPGFSYQTLKARIEQQPGFNTLFGEYRAEMLSRSELGMAANRGTVDHYESNGIEQVRVLDNPRCPICAPFANTVQTLAWAKANPIGHPNCIRAFQSVGSVKAVGVGFAPARKG